jgi:radical SAM superfamily enzyme YgiQ (UPF0313 family)
MNTIIDLHSNLPYNQKVPNAALGYLNSFLFENDIKARNIHWNLILFNIMEEYSNLSKQYKMSQYCIPIDLFISYLSKYLFNVNKKSISSYATNLIDQTIPNKELKNQGKALKNIIDKFIEKQKLYNTEIVGFTMKTNQWILNYYILQKLKKYNPQIKTIIGGIESTSQGLEFMKIFIEADFAIWGEGEQPLVQLIQQINKPTTYKKIPNLIYRDKNKIRETYQINPKDLPDINTYPFANHNDYFETIKKLKMNFIKSIIPIWGTRSCNWGRCKFCVLNEGYLYRERSPENIVREIEYQSKKYNVDNLLFVDNDFGRKDKNDFYKLLNMLSESAKNRGKPYNIRAEISPLRIDKKSIEIMKKIGFEYVQIGFESTSDSLLKKMGKKHRFIDNLQALKLAEEKDFRFAGINIIRGIPKETEEDIIMSTKNIKFLRFLLKKSNLDKYHIKLTRLLLFKRTSFYEEMSEKERQKWDFNFHWLELKKLDFLSEADRFEFFGFLKKELENFNLWDNLEQFLEQYQTNEKTYTWIENKDGSSEIKEIGTYHLDKTETEILKFCNTIKLFKELNKKFAHLTYNKLRQIILGLNYAGLIYVDDNFNKLISVIPLSILKKN